MEYIFNVFCKNKFLLLVTVFLFSNFCFAYEPSLSEISLIGKINSALAQKIKLDNSSKDKILNNLIIYKAKAQTDREVFILSGVYNYISKYTIPGKNTFPEFKKDFLQDYGKDLLGEKNIDKRCLDNYDFIDKIAKKENFPTELILAIWKMETNCNLNNPNNGYGLFQMTSFYFKPGWISQEEAADQVYKFLHIARNKIGYYERKFMKDIDITYDKYDLWSLQMFAGLYVGNWKKVSPASSLYANGNLSKKFEYKKDGIVTSLLKVLYSKYK